MKKIIVGLLLFSIALTAQATNVAVVDIDKILKHYPAVKRIDAQLRKKFAPRGKQVTLAQKALEKKIDELKRNASIMTEVQKGDLQTEITTDKNNLQLKQSRFTQDLQAAQQQAMQKVLAAINAAVVKVAKSHHYQIVLQKSRTVYISSTVDISNSVLAALNIPVKKTNRLTALLNGKS